MCSAFLRDRSQARALDMAISVVRAFVIGPHSFTNYDLDVMPSLIFDFQDGIYHYRRFAAGCAIFQGDLPGLLLEFRLRPLPEGAEGARRHVFTLALHLT